MVGGLALVTVAAIATAAATRRGSGVLVGALLTAGTMGTAVLMSGASPGYAPRTVLVAVVGWTLVCGLFLIDRPVPTVIRVIGLLGWCYVFALSVISLPVTYDDGRTEDLPILANDLVALSDTGKPILVYSTAGMLTDVIDLYAGDQLAGIRVITLMHGERETWTGAGRWLHRGITLAQMEKGELAAALPPDDPGSDSFWYVRRFGGALAKPYFAALGYSYLGGVRLESSEIELWARPGAVLGTSYGADGTAIQDGQWQVTSDVLTEGDVVSGTMSFQLGRGSSRAALTMPATGDQLYSVMTEAWSAGNGPHSPVGRLTMRCLSGAGDILERAATLFAADDLNGNWTSGGVAVMCPAGTESVVLIADHTGEGPVVFRNMWVQQAGVRLS